MLSYAEEKTYSALWAGTINVQNLKASGIAINDPVRLDRSLFWRTFSNFEHSKTYISNLHLAKIVWSINEAMTLTSEKSRVQVTHGVIRRRPSHLCVEEVCPRWACQRSNMGCTYFECICCQTWCWPLASIQSTQHFSTSDIQKLEKRPSTFRNFVIEEPSTPNSTPGDTKVMFRHCYRNCNFHKSKLVWIHRILITLLSQ